MITLLAATLLAVQFPGGAPNEFVGALAKGANRSVVLALSAAHTIPKADFEIDDFDLMARSIRKQTQLAILPGIDLVLSDQLLPKRLVTEVVYRGGGQSESDQLEIESKIAEIRASKLPTSPTASSDLPINFVDLPASSVQNGTITFVTEKSDALQVQKLNGPLSKPVKSHWIYQEIPIYVQVKDMPELDLMKWSAKALGARLIATANEYNFELDPIEVRKRAIAAIVANARPTVGRKEDIAIVQDRQNFRIACLNALTPAQLTEALATPDASTRIELSPRGTLTNLALNQVRALQKYQESIPPGTAGPKSAIGLLQRVDPNRKAYLIVERGFTVTIEVPVLDKDGNPAGVVRL